MSETWQNIYDGFSETYGYTQWILKDAKKVLPEPRPSLRCRLLGHQWSDNFSRYREDEVVVVGCIRCAKRGLVVLETRA